MLLYESTLMKKLRSSFVASQRIKGSRLLEELGFSDV